MCPGAVEDSWGVLGRIPRDKGALLPQPTTDAENGDREGQKETGLSVIALRFLLHQ